MADPRIDAAARDEEDGRRAAAADGKRKRRANMHDGIGVWCDCCSCEAEPRWVAVAEELGIDLGDYEDADTETPPG